MNEIQNAVFRQKAISSLYDSVALLVELADVLRSCGRLGRENIQEILRIRKQINELRNF